MKLHLGVGKNYLEGWTNIDNDPSVRTDVYDDMVVLSKFEGNTVDEIYSCNCLEHLGRYKYKTALKRWFELLKDGGILRISVPDFEAICEYYLKTKDLNSLYCALYAGQNAEWNYHYWCWDFNYLKRDLEEIGFKNIHRFNRDVIKARDWSINYVPYHDANGNELPDDEWFKGTSIALNVESQK